MPGSRWKDDELFKRLEAAMRRAESGRRPAAISSEEEASEAAKLIAAENRELRAALARAESELAERRAAIANLMTMFSGERRRWKAAMMAVRRRLQLARKKRGGKL